MIWFLLWREFKLSIAEIVNIFPDKKVFFYDKQILILENLEKTEILEIAKNLWWIIKIFEVKKLESKEEFLENLFLEANNFESKFNYAINIFWNSKTKLSELLKKSKRIFKEKQKSARFANNDLNKNLSSAQIINNKLLTKWWDFNFIASEKQIFFWKTFWVQDIENYSKRDYEKQTDMQVWMLPPKLSQMMINIGKNNEMKDNIYDPFVGLWTILIEASLMWFKNVYWSDISDRMVETSISNLRKLKNTHSLDFYFEIVKQNAKFIHEENILIEKKADLIITEWYLWEVMTQNNISEKRIFEQRERLKELYERFFSWLQKLNFSWIIIICFPFWELPLSNSLPKGERTKIGRYIYFEEIYNILNKYTEIQKIFSDDLKLETKVWSLLYKREKQLVWREIFKLKIK